MNVPSQWRNKDTPGNGGFAMFCSDFIVSPPTEDVNKKTHICEVCLLGDAPTHETFCHSFFHVDHPPSFPRGIP